MTDKVLYERDGHVATITYNRPEAMNALSQELRDDLDASWVRFRSDDEAWVAIVTGAGRAFCAGHDLKGGAVPRGTSHWETPSLTSLENGLEVWKPVIAAVNGYCLAGGMTLLFATDIRVAAEHATFGISEVKRGILPGNGGTQRAVRNLPYSIAMELVLIGAQITAQQAYQYGLLNQVVPKQQLMDTARDYARRLCANAPLAVRAIKELAVRSQYMHIADGLRLESAIQQVLRQSEDAKEGPRAFAEKRPPVYRGR